MYIIFLSWKKCLSKYKVSVTQTQTIGPKKKYERCKRLINYLQGKIMGTRL